jgi:hypothetical protein
MADILGFGVVVREPRRSWRRWWGFRGKIGAAVDQRWPWPEQGEGAIATGRRRRKQVVVVGGSSKSGHCYRSS